MSRLSSLLVCGFLVTGVAGLLLPTSPKELAMVLANAGNRVPAASSAAETSEAAAAAVPPPPAAGAPTQATLAQTAAAAATAAGAPPPAMVAGAPPPNPVKFFKVMSTLLTCEDLEETVRKTCAKQAVYKALPQLKSLPECEAARHYVPAFRDGLVQFFGSMADCSTRIDLWKTHGFKSADECAQATRVSEFGEHCRIPLDGGAAAGAPTPATQAQTVAVAAPSAGSPTPATLAQMAAAVATAAGAPPPSVVAGAPPPNPVKFFKVMSTLLTCEDLEQTVRKTCAKQAIYQALPQLKSLPECEAARHYVPAFRDGLVQFYGSMADCSTRIDLWKTHGFKSADECAQATRVSEFEEHCRIPVDGVAAAGATTPATQAQTAAAAALSAGSPTPATPAQTPAAAAMGAGALSPSVVAGATTPATPAQTAAAAATAAR